MALFNGLRAVLKIDDSEKCPGRCEKRNTRDIFEGNILVFAYVHTGIPREPLLCVKFAPAGFRKVTSKI